MSDATKFVHWPGQTTAACDEHTAKLESLARAMGFFVDSTPAPAGIPCANCENERKDETAIRQA